MIKCLYYYFYSFVGFPVDYFISTYMVYISCTSLSYPSFVLSLLDWLEKLWGGVVVGGVVVFCMRVVRVDC